MLVGPRELEIGDWVQVGELAFEAEDVRVYWIGERQEDGAGD